MRMEKTVSENRLDHEESYYDMQNRNPELYIATEDIKEVRNGAILRCLHCNELFRPTEYDSKPAFHFDDESGLIMETEMDDLRAFMKEHEGHKIVELHMIDGSLCSHYAYWEPIREDYLQVTDGVRVYTIKRWRSDINDPLKYEIINARIELRKPILRVQSVELMKQMIADARMLKLDEEEIKKFVQRFESFVPNVELADTIECGFSTDDPMVSYVALDDRNMEEFLSQCRSLFTDEELKRLRVFINANSEYNDVMNVLVIRDFQLVR